MEGNQVPPLQPLTNVHRLNHRPGVKRSVSVLATPYDWVDEGKLLLFTTERVVNRSMVSDDGCYRRGRQRGHSHGAGGSQGGVGRGEGVFTRFCTGAFLLYLHATR